MYIHQQVQERLLTAREESYAALMRRLIPHAKPLLGVRVPVLRREAARLASQNAWEAYFAEPDATHEEQMIHAFLFSRVRDDDALQREAARWMDEIENWCVCDAFCQSYLTARRQSAQTKRMIQQLAASQEEFRQRTAFVLCLTHFLKSDFSWSFTLLCQTQCNGYYARMGKAWALAEAAHLQPARVLRLLEDIPQDDIFFYTAGKICDSQRIDDCYKQQVRAMRRSRRAAQKKTE